MQRLDKMLSEAGIGSRKEIRGIVKSGRVCVNGVTAVSPEMHVGEEDTVELDGMPVSRNRTVVLVMYKPVGYVTSSDEPGQTTVMELLPQAYRKMGVMPVGRLDKQTEGLLLFTNDGALAHRLISPRSVIEKEYEAGHEGEATTADVEAFAAGLTLRDGTKCRPAVLIPEGPGRSRIVLTEGKYHQVRRMMAARGMHVLTLRRVREGTLSLGTLQPGKCRELQAQEVAALYAE